ncbi:MAG: MBL fold metallo-hydrolase [Oscillospiraceae bacterium]|nr:MBL fold metallo-hydrolase [Oscillospiraceae bacterium]
MLIGQFWGTSAAEGIPAPYCRCPVCLEAREKGGIYSRMRSCFRLSDKIMLDLGADAVAQSMRFGDITDIEHVLITHTHDDHLNPHMLMEAMWSKRFRKPIHYYFTEEAFEITRLWMDSPWILKGMLRSWVEEGIVVFHQLKFGERTKVGDVFVTPFRGNHKGNVEPNSAMYLVELPDGRSLFYGLDSGKWLPETLEAVKKLHLDIFISEATAGIHFGRYGGHMCLEQVRELVGELFDSGAITPETKVYLTHINHGSSHDQMLEAVDALDFPLPVTVAVDGMKIF